MPKPIQKAWEFDITQTIDFHGKRYSVHEAIRQIKILNLPVQEIRIDQVWMGYFAPCANTLRSFLEHLRMVNEADLSYPIIFNQDMDLIDGKHRLCKAIYEGHETIKYYKFDKDPDSIYTETK